jgi:hypothetical protein
MKRILLLENREKEEEAQRTEKEEGEEEEEKKEEEAQSAEKESKLKALQKTCDETETIILQIFPMEVIYKILLYCGIVELHTLRFVCEQFHIIVHNYGSMGRHNFSWNLNICATATLYGNLGVLKRYAQR